MLLGLLVFLDISLDRIFINFYVPFLVLLFINGNNYLFVYILYADVFLLFFVTGGLLDPEGGLPIPTFFRLIPEYGRFEAGLLKVDNIFWLFIKILFGYYFF